MRHLILALLLTAPAMAGDYCVPVKGGMEICVGWFEGQALNICGLTP